MIPTLAKIPPELEKPMALAKEYVDLSKSPFPVLNSLRSLHKRWEDKILPLATNLDNSSGKNFIVVLREFLKDCYNKKGDQLIHPACLQRNSWEYISWEREFMEEMQRRHNQARVAEKADREARFSDLVEKAQGEYDNYGEQHTRQFYPANVVDAVIRRMIGR